MTAVVIREKLHQIVSRASDSKVKAMYTLMKDEESNVDDKWNDEAFVNELERRADAYFSGKEKGYTRNEANDFVKKEYAKSKK